MAKFNSLTPGRLEWNLISVIFSLILVNGGWGIKCETALRCMSLNLTEDKSTLVKVMAWCRQATSHYLSQCWPRSLPSYGITRSQWVNGGCSSKTTLKPMDRNKLSITCSLQTTHSLPSWVSYGVFIVIIRGMIGRIQLTEFRMSGEVLYLGWFLFLFAEHEYSWFMSLVIIWSLFCKVLFNSLTHCGLVVPYGDIDLGQHWFR